LKSARLPSTVIVYFGKEGVINFDKKGIVMHSDEDSERRGSGLQIVLEW